MCPYESSTRTAGTDNQTPPARRLATKSETATHVRRTARTLENWLRRGFITAYRADARTLLFDLNEIDRALLANPRMRDGRKVYGDAARIVPLSSVESTS